MMRVMKRAWYFYVAHATMRGMASIALGMSVAISVVTASCCAQYNSFEDAALSYTVLIAPHGLIVSFMYCTEQQRSALIRWFGSCVTLLLGLVIADPLMSGFALLHPESAAAGRTFVVLWYIVIMVVWIYLTGTAVTDLTVLRRTKQERAAEEEA